MVRGNQNLKEKLVDKVEEYVLAEYYHDEIETLAKNYPGRRSLYIDFNDLKQANEDLAYDVLNQPEGVLEYFEEALRVYDHSSDTKLGNARVRFRNLPQQTTTNDLRADEITLGGLVEIQGTVHRKTDVQQAITDCAFQCQRCGSMNMIPIGIGEELQEPRECHGCERQGPFEIDKDSSEFVDRQKIWLLESRENLPDGDSPETVEVYLEEDIAGTVAAGDVVTVVGIVRLEQSKASGHGSNTFEPHLDGISVSSNDSRTQFTLSNVEGALDIQTYAEIAPATFSGLPDETREEETKAKLIMPFIEALGWNKFDNSELRMEYSDSMTNLRPDYALFGEDSDDPDVIVEAKQIGSNLDEHTNQICEYLRLYSAKWGVLTNGERFYIYHLDQDQTHPRKLAELSYSDLPTASVTASISRDSFYGE